MPQNSQPLDLAEALTQLTAQIQPMAGRESLPLAAAAGRVLAEAVHAPVDMPPFAASAMDGYAVTHAAWQSAQEDAFTLLGESLAGHPFDGAISGRQAVRVFTGAALPHGADLVLLQEQVATADDKQVTFKPHKITERYVRPVGHDMTRGQLLLDQGASLTALSQGMLAAAGIASVNVYHQPRVGVFSTGDELVDAGIPSHELQPGQIYDSNRLTVLSLLAGLPVELIDLGRLADDPQVVAAALSDACRNCDMLITSGGVSVGDADFITATIKQLGTLKFWRLNLKPGKPLAYGQIGKCHIFGLPGNPVSTIVTLLLIARPALQHLCGALPHPPLRVAATTTATFKHSPGRAEYQRGVYSIQQGGLQVTPTGDQSSNRMTTFATANCLVEIPGDAVDIAAGASVQVLPFSGLLGG